jgi:hypothetical protein
VVVVVVVMGVMGVVVVVVVWGVMGVVVVVVVVRIGLVMAGMPPNSEQHDSSSAA